MLTFFLVLAPNLFAGKCNASDIGGKEIASEGDYEDGDLLVKAQGNDREDVQDEILEGLAENASTSALNTTLVMDGQEEEEEEEEEDVSTDSIPRFEENDAAISDISPTLDLEEENESDSSLLLQLQQIDNKTTTRKSDAVDATTRLDPEEEEDVTILGDLVQPETTTTTTTLETDLFSTELTTKQQSAAEEVWTKDDGMDPAHPGIVETTTSEAASRTFVESTTNPVENVETSTLAEHDSELERETRKPAMEEKEEKETDASIESTTNSLTGDFRNPYSANIDDDYNNDVEEEKSQNSLQDILLGLLARQGRVRGQDPEMPPPRIFRVTAVEPVPVVNGQAIDELFHNGVFKPAEQDGDELAVQALEELSNVQFASTKDILIDSNAEEQQDKEHEKKVKEKKEEKLSLEITNTQDEIGAVNETFEDETDDDSEDIETTDNGYTLLNPARPCVSFFSLTSFSLNNRYEEGEKLTAEQESDLEEGSDNCMYIIERQAPSICALNLEIHTLELDEDCSREHWQIGPDLRLCGNLTGTIRQVEFSREMIVLAMFSETGNFDAFYNVTVRQLDCGFEETVVAVVEELSQEGEVLLPGYGVPGGNGGGEVIDIGKAKKMDFSRNYD